MHERPLNVRRGREEVFELAGEPNHDAPAVVNLNIMAVLLAHSLLSPEFLPGIFTSDEKATLLLFGIGWGLAVGFLEELGSTRFAVPTLLRLRYGVLALHQESVQHQE